MDMMDDADDSVIEESTDVSMIPGTDSLMTVVDMSTNEHLSEVDTDTVEQPENGTYSEEDSENSSEVGSERIHADDNANGYGVHSRHPARVRRSRGPNGHKPIDLTPPDRLLRKSERKVVRYIERKKSDKVVHELIRCTVLSRLVYGDRHWRLARAHTKLASGYLDLKGYTAQAIYHTEIAENVLRNHVVAEDYSTEKPLVYAVYVEMYYTLGRALTMEKKLTEADTALGKAEKLLQELSRMPLVIDDDIEDWTIKLSLATGRLNFRQQRFALSITYFERALDLLQKKYGNESPQLISVYQSIGRVEQGKGKQADHLRAIEHFLQAHSIATTSFDETGVEVAETAYALGLAYTNVGNEDAENSAESYFNQALKSYESLYGSTHEKSLEIKDELSRLMIRTDRVQDAITLLLSTIEHKQDRYGDLSAPVAETWKIIGNSHLSMGNAEKALQALQKCYEIECLVYSASSRKSKDTQKTINLLLLNPNLAAKQKKSKEQELKQRPRFSSVAKSATSLGGFKPQL